MFNMNAHLEGEWWRAWQLYKQMVNMIIIFYLQSIEIISTVCVMETKIDQDLGDN